MSDPEAPTGRRAVRRTPPRRRASQTRSYEIGGAAGLVTTATYEDRSLAEIDLRMDKHGSTLSGLMDATGTAWTIGLQHGVPLADYVVRMQGLHGEPSGPTDDPEIPTATSAFDYLARRLAADHLGAAPAQSPCAATDTRSHSRQVRSRDS